MHFYRTEQLLVALEHRLREAKNVDIAVAWAWSCSALELLDEAASRGVKIRAIVGLAGNGSQPTALRSLASFADVRIASDLGGTFHPKVFIFRSLRESIGWVGSANLTTGGFVKNVEGVIEVSNTTEAEEWFDELWASLDEDPMPAIEEYEKDWVPPQWGPTKPKNSKKRGTPKPPSLREGSPSSWAAFMEVLKEADSYWLAESDNYGYSFSVLGETYSWLDTIQTGRLLARRANWLGLSDGDRNILLGLGSKTGAWGLLGGMGGAADAKKIFRAKTAGAKQKLQHLRNAIAPVISADTCGNAADAACRALEQMCTVKGVSIGVATRLLALARPDVCVSVNAGSAPGLAKILGRSFTDTAILKPKNYQQVLEWVARQPWYKAQRPTAALETAVWDMRAALMDCFVYEPLV